MHISGDEFKGLEHFTSMQEAENFIAQAKSWGYKIKKVVRKETILGERIPVSPPSIKVYYRMEI